MQEPGPKLSPAQCLLSFRQVTQEVGQNADGGCDELTAAPAPALFYTQPMLSRVCSTLKSRLHTGRFL